MDGVSASSLNGGRVYPYDVKSSEDGELLLELFSRVFRHSSRAEWSAHIAAGRLRSAGVALAADARVRAGMIVEYHRPPWREPATSTLLPVIHRDPALIVLRKPSGKSLPYAVLQISPLQPFWPGRALESTSLVCELMSLIT